MQYFLYRVLEQPKSQSVIPIDYLPADGEKAVDGDEFVVYVAGTHLLMGIYKKQGENLILVDKPIKHLTVKDIMGQLSFVTFVDERTKRMFKKKVREITTADMAMIKEKLC